MSKKRYRVHTFIEDYPCGFKDLEDNTCEVFCDDNRMTYREVVDKLNKLHEEKEQLEKENAILKITIARNESYISRVTHKGEWKNTTQP